MESASFVSNFTLERWGVGAMDSALRFNRKYQKDLQEYNRRPRHPGSLAGRKPTIHTLTGYCYIQFWRVSLYAYLLHTDCIPIAYLYAYTHTQYVRRFYGFGFLIFTYIYIFLAASISDPFSTCLPGTNGKRQAQRSRLSQRASPRTTSMP